MATATAPAKREIVHTEVRGRERWHRYTWGDAEHGGEEWATEPIQPVAREILEDRWLGLLEHSQGGDYTELGNDLSQVLSDLVDGVTRRDSGPPDQVVVDGRVTGLDMVMDVDGLIAAIHDWIIERAAPVARP